MRQVCFSIYIIRGNFVQFYALIFVTVIEGVSVDSLAKAEARIQTLVDQVSFIFIVNLPNILGHSTLILHLSVQFFPIAWNLAQ